MDAFKRQFSMETGTKIKNSSWILSNICASLLHVKRHVCARGGGRCSRYKTHRKSWFVTLTNESYDIATPEPSKHSSLPISASKNDLTHDSRAHPINCNANRNSWAAIYLMVARVLRVPLAFTRIYVKQITSYIQKSFAKRNKRVRVEEKKKQFHRDRMIRFLLFFLLHVCFFLFLPSPNVARNCPNKSDGNHIFIHPNMYLFIFIKEFLVFAHSFNSKQQQQQQNK